MNSCTKSTLKYVSILICTFFLVACGIPGELYMPETYSTKPPPKPRTTKMKKDSQNTSTENTTNKEKN